MATNKYQEPEENKAEQSAAAKSAKFAAENKSNVYWAPAEQYQIANFQREERDGGSIVKPERPLRFTNHIISTSDKAEIEFIESSDSFKNGSVKKCHTVEDANKLTAQRNAMKGVRTVNVQDVSSTKIQEKVA